MKRLLWITPKWPLPANDGARQATTQLVSALCAAGTSIDLLALVPQDETVVEQDALDELGVRSARVVRRPNPGRGLHLRNALRSPSRALTLSQYSTKALSEVLNEVISEPGTVIVFDGLHAAASLQEVDAMPSAPIIYRAHNVEAELWFKTAARAKGIVKRLTTWQGKAVQRFESALCSVSRLVLTVSDADADRFRQLVPGANVHTIPIAMDPKPHRSRPARDDQILFVGRLDWPPNRDGLRWFLERVWPNVTRPFTLTIVGSGDGRWVSSYRDDPRIRFLGQVDSVTPHYHGSIASLVPIFYGSGTRVKAIESCLHATACVGTECGVEGLGLDPTQDYFPAETDEQWIDILNNLEVDAARERGKNALHRVAARYDRRRIAEEFVRVARASMQA